MDAKLIKLRMDAQYMAKQLGELTSYPINCGSVIKLVDMIEKLENEIQALTHPPPPSVRNDRPARPR